jgi:hypothetical protein
MPSVTNPADGSCTIFFMDSIINRALKFVAFNQKDQHDIDGNDLPNSHASNKNKTYLPPKEV